MKMRIANSVVVRFDETSPKRLVNMVLSAQEKGTWTRKPKQTITDKEK